MKIPKRLYTLKYRRLLTILISIIAIALESISFMMVLQFLRDANQWHSLCLGIVIHAMPSFLFASLSIFARFSITDDLITLLNEKKVWDKLIEKLQNIQNEMFVLEKTFQQAVEKEITMELDDIAMDEKEIYLESKNLILKYMMTSYPPEERKDIRRLYYFSHLIGWISFFMPVIGLAGCLCVYFSLISIVKTKGLAEDYQEETSHVIDDDPLPDSVKNHEAFVSDELNVEPIRDILNSDDAEMKRGAVEYLGRISTPEAVQMLKECLADDSPEVRFMSHTMLGRIDEKHVKRIKKIQEDLDKASSEDQPTLQEKLGYCYKAYAESQLMEISTRDYYLKQSEQAYLDNLSLTKSDDPNILYTLAQIYSLLEDPQNAKVYFDKGRQSALDNEAFMLALRNMIGLAEWLYHESNYEELVELVKKMPDAIEKGYHQYKKLHQENPKNIIIRKLFFQFTFLSKRKEEAQLLQDAFQEEDPLKSEHIGIISFWLQKKI